MGRAKTTAQKANKAELNKVAKSTKRTNERKPPFRFGKIDYHLADNALYSTRPAPNSREANTSKGHGHITPLHSFEVESYKVSTPLDHKKRTRPFIPELHPITDTANSIQTSSIPNQTFEIAVSPPPAHLDTLPESPRQQTQKSRVSEKLPSPQQDIQMKASPLKPVSRSVPPTPCSVRPRSRVSYLRRSSFAMSSGMALVRASMEGKTETLRRLSMCRKSLLRPEEAKQQSEETKENQQPDTGVPDVSHFRAIVATHEQKFELLCTTWEPKTIPLEYEEEVRVAIGNARLLLNKRSKFRQFEGLIDKCETKTGEKEIRIDDLDGFWNLISPQMDEIYTKFEKLSLLEMNQWIPKEEEETVEKQVAMPNGAAKKKKLVAKKPVVKSKFAEFRKNLIKTNSQEAPTEVAAAKEAVVHMTPKEAELRRSARREMHASPFAQQVGDRVRFRDHENRTPGTAEASFLSGGVHFDGDNASISLKKSRLRSRQGTPFAPRHDAYNSPGPDVEMKEHASLNYGASLCDTASQSRFDSPSYQIQEGKYLNRLTNTPYDLRRRLTLTRLNVQSPFK